MKKVKSPIEYVTKRVDFLGCSVDLSKKPFIPRIETEYWVKKAIKDISGRKGRKVKVLDIFSGSGCIGLAVLKNIPFSIVDFADIDKDAVLQIKINLKLNKIPPKRYKVYKSDFFEKIKSKKYEFILANPPYVAEERKNEVEKSVLKYEPEKALFSGKEGFDHLRKFLKHAKKFLNKKGLIYLEFDPKQKNEIAKIFKKEGYNKFEFFRDQFKKYRFAKIGK